MPSIDRIEAHVFNVSSKTNWIFLALTDSHGRTAWGEASLIGWEPLLVEATRQLERDWQGKPLDLALTSMRASPQSPGGLVFNTAVSACQQALLCLVGHEKLPTLQRNSVPAYANINRATQQRTPQGFVDTALRARAKGFTRFKAAPFDKLTPALCTTDEGAKLISHGVDCMLALRDALGPDALLMVDCHWRFDETRALTALKALTPALLHWFECPIAENHAHWPATRRIRNAARDQSVLLAAAETQVGLASFKMLFDEGLYDVVMPDVKYCGGPLEMLRIAEQAQEQGVHFSPHNPSGPVCTWHSIQVAAMAPACEMLELQFDESPLYDQLFDTASIQPIQGEFKIGAAYATAPNLNAQLFQAHPHQSVPPGIETLLNR